MEREKIEQRYKWNLKDIYENYDSWNRDLERIKGLQKDLVKYKGSFSSEEKLLEFLKKQEELDKIAYKLYRYPQLAKDLNSLDKEAVESLQKIQFLFSEISTELSWVNPELIENRDKIEKYIENEEFSDYRFGIENLFRLQKHVLDEKESRLMSYFSSYFSSPRAIYSEITVTDVEWPEVELENGEKIRATAANYSKEVTRNRNQKDRKTMFENYYGVFKKRENTIAAIYNSILQKNIAKMKAYNYDTFLLSALEGDNIPQNVYTNLINTVNKEYEYDEAKEIVLKSIIPLGKEYESKMKRAVSEGWLDVFETKGKRSGAYSAGVYGVHPYMLLNYNKTMDSIFTLAHELGHTLHTLYSQENQPFSTSDYTIFVAEVASTFNERLLLDYMLEHTDSTEERIALLEQEIRNITGTFYFQALLAEYEYKAHKLAEEGHPITAEVLSGIIEELFEGYYGNEMERDELVHILWSRVPHFFNSPFYVYQYATCFASSAVLYEKVIKEKDEKKKKEALKRYIELLSSGGSKFPMEQLKEAGADLEEKSTVEAVSRQLDSLLDKLEEEIVKIKKYL